MLLSLVRLLCVRPSAASPLDLPVSGDLYQIKGDANTQLYLGPLRLHTQPLLGVNGPRADSPVRVAVSLLGLL